MRKQSDNLSSTVSLIEIISKAVDNTRAKTTATVTDVDLVSGNITLTGDFSDFIFSCNPSNNTEKEINITKDGNTELFKRGELQENNTVIIDINSDLPLSELDEVTCTEADPFVFEGTILSVHQLEKKQPAIWVSNPQKEKISYSKIAPNSTDSVYKNVTILVTDFSDDYNKNDSFISPSDGWDNTHYYTKYVFNPLRVRINRLLNELSYKRFEGLNGLNPTVILEDKQPTLENIEFIGKQHGKSTTLEKSNVSGFRFTLDLTVIANNCLNG